MVLFSGNNEGWEEQCPGPGGYLRRTAYRVLSRLLPEGEDGPGRASLAVHEYRVRRMARLAKRKGVPLIICSLPVNLLMPPFGEAPYGDRDFADGLYRLERKDLSGASRAFGALLERAPREPFGLYYSGLSRYKAKDAGGALPYLKAAVDMSPKQDRAGPARNRMLAKAAREEGACFADLERAFYEESSGGVPGFFEFDDAVHWEKRFNSLVWRTIGEAAASCGAPLASLKKDGSAPPGKGKGISYAFAYSLAPYSQEMALAAISYLRQNSPALLDKALVSPSLLRAALSESEWFDSSPERVAGSFHLFLSAAGEAFRRTGEYGRALRLADRSLEAAPDQPAAVFLRGAALFGLGRPKEAGEVLAGIAYHPSEGAKVRAFCAVRGISLPTPPPENVALHLIARSKEMSDRGKDALERGDFGRAADHFREALEADPFNTGAAEGLKAAEGKRKPRPARGK
ncbi:MAG: tetratricopeptide repeat protein [Elusimicrobiales bacterium]|nr:tetratricopeptide repeat protein [Elusimicrobiales bacterium]